MDSPLLRTKGKEAMRIESLGGGANANYELDTRRHQELPILRIMDTRRTHSTVITHVATEKLCHRETLHGKWRGDHKTCFLAIITEGKIAQKEG